MEATFYPSRNKDSKIVAFADVTVADGIIVRGFRIVDGANGLFAAVPSRGSTVEGKPRFWNQVVFTDTETRERFLFALLDEYRRWREAGGESHPRASGELDETGAAPPF